uniref:CUB-like domain-containing protein n=1 Tax=Caenorhabditis japonica TaxID=281687 RepID=A0A8R1E783_CAEJA
MNIIFFIANGGRIQLATRESNVIFGFAVNWTKLPRNFASFNDNVTISQSQPVVYWAFSTYPIQIRAETKVSLVITPPVEDELMQYLRSIIIYDGPDWNSTSLGTGLQLFAGKRQYVSSGSYMTVQQLAPAFPLGRTMLVFQDYENTKDIVEYQGATCARVENCGQFLMDGSIGMAAVTTVNERSDSGAECVNSMSGSGDLDVYIGGKTKSKSNLIASYQIGDDSNKLPQEFLGYVRTYVLTGNNAKVNTSRSCESFYNSGVVGRKGFFASRFYKSGVNSGMQSVYESIKSFTGLSKNRVNFSFTIKEADFVGNTTMEVTVYDNGKESYRQLFTATNQPNLNSQIEKLGDDFSVNYKTYNYETKGFYLEFEILKSSSRYGIFGLFIIVFMYLF